MSSRPWLRGILTVALALSLGALGCSSSDTNKNDGGGGSSDTGGGGGGDGGGGYLDIGGGPSTSATLFDINQGKVTEGKKVKVTGVVITAIDAFGDYKGDIIVQDPKGGKFSAIKLFRSQRIDGGDIAKLAVGDVIEVEGVVKYFAPSGGFNDKAHPNKTHVKQLDNARITVTQGGGTPITPTEVTAAELTKDPDAEGWEYVLVTLKDVRARSEANPNYNGDFDVDGGLTIGADLFGHKPKVRDCLTISGISMYFFRYRVHPRSDKDVVASTGCKEPAKLSIKDVQDTTSAKHPSKGDLVTITGVVTAVDGRTSGSTPRYYGFFVQDGTGAYSGIYIFHSWDDKSTNKPVEGETYEITGEVDEYFDLTQLKSVTWKKVTAQSAPAPEVIANPADIATKGSKAEQYEGVLVKVENVEVLEHTKDKSGKVLGFKLKTSNLYVEADLHDFATSPPAPGTTYKSITGVLTYSFNNFKILPRKAADLEK